METKLILNEDIAELIGMHTGDGTLYRTNRSLVWELRGALNEKEYYDYNVIQLLQNIFHEKFKAKFRSGGKSGCYGVQISKKEVTKFFLNYGFKPGTKTYTIRIPDYLMRAPRSIKLAFLRGLFDTDGCLRFDKNHTKRNYYPKIEFDLASKKLIKDLSILLNKLNFHNYIWNSKSSTKLCISGRSMLDKWIKEVKPKNSKHLNKYEIVRKTGAYHAEVAQPGTALI